MRARCLIPLAASLLLAGCGDTATDKFAPACPQLSLLKDAASVTRFSGTTQDAATLVLAARIAAVPAACASAGPGKVKATLHVVADLARGPAAVGNAVTIPYFVALMDGEKVLNEQDFAIHATFPANADSSSARDDDIVLTMPVTKTRTAAAYHIYIGFRLTPAELTYNRRQTTP